MKTVQLAMQVRVLALSLGIILSGLVVSGTAGAASMTFSFTGTVQGFDAPLVSAPFAVGQPMSGFFTTVSPLVDNSGAPHIARYNNQITGLSVSIGAAPYIATFGDHNNHIIIRDQSASDSAELVVNKQLTGATVNGLFKPTKFEINLVGPTTVFASKYPATVPPMASFTTFNQWRLIFKPGSAAVWGKMDSVSITSVPLPSAVILFGAGLVALVGLGAGSWRQKKNSLA